MDRNTRRLRYAIISHSYGIQCIYTNAWRLKRMWKTKSQKIIIIFHLPDWSDRGWLKDGELPLRRPFLNYRMHVNRWMNKFSFNFDLDENIETTLRLQSFRLTFIALQWFYHTFTVKIIGNTCLCKCMFVCGPQCKLVPTATLKEKYRQNKDDVRVIYWQPAGK